MELAKQFGIEPILLVAQIVNFLIILFLLKKLLLKPVQKMLKDRKNAIREGLDKAEEARLLLEKTQKEEKEILQKAQARAEKMLESAKNQASELLNLAKEQSKEESQRMIEEAKEQIQKEAELAQNKVINHVGELSLQILKKALSSSVSPKTQKELMDQAVKQIKKSN